MNVINLAILKLFHSLYKKDSSNKKQTHNITSVEEIEADLVRPTVGEKNKWLYPTNEFGKMEKGVVD